MNKSPIFIHSLFRAGSTYLFNVFRRSDADFWCYQEPMHELAFFSRNNPDELLVDHGKEKQELLRHPPTNINYFQELYDTWDSWCDAIKEEAIYDTYFEQKPSDKMGLPYWLSLIKAAKGRPVFQECRTSGRIGAIKAGLGGYHIYLWRNPWDQWWSYKVTPYFDVATRLIVHSKNAPVCLQKLCNELGLLKHELINLDEAFSVYGSEPLSSEQSYLLFFMLWCLALQAGLQEADVLVNIDWLSRSKKYREKILNTLKKDADISGIDFSDCSVPQALYDWRDLEFFSQLEDRIYRLLLQGGWQQKDIEMLKKLRQQFRTEDYQEHSPSVLASMAEQSSRARKLARQWETELARRTREFEEKLKKYNITEHHSELIGKDINENIDPEFRDLLVRIAAAEDEKVEIECELKKTETELQKAHQDSQYHWARLQQSNTQINALLHSFSWRITAPLRWLLGLVIRLFSLPFSYIQKFLVRRGMHKMQPGSASNTTDMLKSELNEISVEDEAWPRAQTKKSLSSLAQRFNEQYKKQLDTFSNRFNKITLEAEVRYRDQVNQSLDVLLKKLDERLDKRLEALDNKFHKMSIEYEIQTREQIEQLHIRLVQQYDKEQKNRLDGLIIRFNEMAAEIDARQREIAKQHESAITELASELEALKGNASVRETSQVGISAEYQKHLESVTIKLNESLGNAHNWYLRATNAEQRVYDLLHSGSWRITAPLRWLRDLIVWLLLLPFRLCKAIVHYLIVAIVKMALKNPQMCDRWVKRLRKHRTLFGYIQKVAMNKGLMEKQSVPVVFPNREEPTELQYLTPRAQEVYQELQDVIARNRKRN